MSVKPKKMGGRREGSGRKRTGRAGQNYYVTPEEDKKIRTCLAMWRKAAA